MLFGFGNLSTLGITGVSCGWRNSQSSKQQSRPSQRSLANLMFRLNPQTSQMNELPFLGG